MDSVKPASAPTKSKFAKTFNKVIHLRAATKTLSNTGFCLLIPHGHKLKRDLCQESHCFGKENGDHETRSTRSRAAALEAFVAKLFATVSAVKAAYADLQMAQFPYNSEAVQSADESVVRELRSLSELKQSFLKKQLDSSPPHVTMLLAEIQEQQSLTRMYEITMKKMQTELEAKEKDVSALHGQLDEIIAVNKSLENTLNSSGQFSVLDCVKLSDPNPNSFNVALHYALRSVRSFVKLMIREMESSNWDIEAAANAIIELELRFPKANHRCFAFESFVCREIFDGFDSRGFSLLPSEEELRGFVFVDRFKKLKAANPVQFLKSDPNSAFGKFTRAKYLRLVHPKMETSFAGNLNQRKLINSGGGYPETAFFAAFAEMAKRVWLLHCLAFSFDQEVEIFRVGKNSRFSEVYMESVTDDVALAAAAEDGLDGGFRVAFTVVPGFRIGKTVIQSQVYLFPARA